MEKNTEKVVESILEGADIKLALEGKEEVNEAAANAKAIIAAVKKLKSGFEGPALEKAIKGAVKDEAEAEALVDYFKEIEEEDGLVSAFLDGEVSEKEFKAAVDSFINDVLNESEQKPETDPVNEGVDAQAKKIAKALKDLTPGEFTGDELVDALSKGGATGDLQEELYEYLSEIEEEEGTVSQLASGDMSVDDFAELLVSFLED